MQRQLSTRNKKSQIYTAKQCNVITKTLPIKNQARFYCFFTNKWTHHPNIMTWFFLLLFEVEHLTDANSSNIAKPNLLDNLNTIIEQHSLIQAFKGKTKNQNEFHHFNIVLLVSYVIHRCTSLFPQAST